MSTAQSYIPHYTVSNYQQWQGDWELMGGIAIAMTPSPFGLHQRVCSRLIVLLSNSLDHSNCPCEAIHELDWIVSQDTVVRPDVMILSEGVPEKHLTSTPALVAEVLSVSTAAKDRTAKRDLYEAQRVPYYLLVDPESESLEVFTLNSETRYDSVAIGPGQLEFTLPGPCRFSCDFTSLFESRRCSG